MDIIFEADLEEVCETSCSGNCDGTDATWSCSSNTDD